ncbi:hypothetical protein E2C01_086889 [Portunus trituberculatus]|uniref:Uncharacterized protein n=1 Tax=Portunus trituberculatus TaxID=210409 RepID=A0A5B7JAI9_PORTR|nr:hypothetical protein [Portunus trituberculatus]
MKELTEEDPATLRNWIRLDREQYEELLALITPLIQKQDTNMRRAVTAAERLTLTLRFLASVILRLTNRIGDVKAVRRAKIR